MVAWTLAGERSALSILGKRVVTLAARARDARRRIATAARLALRMILVLTALVLFTVAAWTFALSLGLVVAAVSCLVLEWLIKDGPRGERR